MIGHKTSEVFKAHRCACHRAVSPHADSAAERFRPELYPATVKSVGPRCKWRPRPVTGTAGHELVGVAVGARCSLSQARSAACSSTLPNSAARLITIQALPIHLFPPDGERRLLFTGSFRICLQSLERTRVLWRSLTLQPGAQAIQNRQVSCSVGWPLQTTGPTRFRNRVFDGYQGS